MMADIGRLSLVATLVLLLGGSLVHAQTTRVLPRPYEDAIQYNVPFGADSWWLSPWRSYMDTWPAFKYLDVLGINFNGNPVRPLPPLSHFFSSLPPPPELRRLVCVLVGGANIFFSE